MQGAQNGDSIALCGPGGRQKVWDNQTSYSLMPRLPSQIFFQTHGEAEYKYDQEQEFEYKTCKVKRGYSFTFIRMIRPRSRILCNVTRDGFL